MKQRMKTPKVNRRLYVRRVLNQLSPRLTGIRGQNPKSETNPNSEIQNSKTDGFVFRSHVLKICIWDFEFVSDFEFRISNLFSAAVRATQENRRVTSRFDTAPIPHGCYVLTVS
jgi:hypothetical protein